MKSKIDYIENYKKDKELHEKRQKYNVKSNWKEKPKLNKLKDMPFKFWKNFGLGATIFAVTSLLILVMIWTGLIYGFTR